MDLAPFQKMAREGPCADRRNRLSLMDGQLVCRRSLREALEGLTPPVKGFPGAVIYPSVPLVAPPTLPPAPAAEAR